MIVLSAFIIFNFIGSLRAREADIDTNRVQLLPQAGFPITQPYNSHDRRSIKAYQLRANDFNDHSSWHTQSRAPLHVHQATASTTKDSKTAINVHQPREDPRLFYQSDSYLKEILGRNVNHEISFIYPGREVIRADQENGHRSLPLRLEPGDQDIVSDDSNICVRCPHDRTLIAKAGSDRVILEHPRLFSCSGQRTPRNIRFVHMYGPKFGSLLEQGSYMIVGRTMYKHKSLNLCKMQVHVVYQGCVTPKYLISQCETQNKSCNFTCRDRRLELHGHSSLFCGDNLKWSGDLPICKARIWCEPPSPPEHGRISCKGVTAGSGAGLAEGSKCRLKCARGWRWSPRGVAVCRRGAWTQALVCQPKKGN